MGIDLISRRKKKGVSSKIIKVQALKILENLKCPDKDLSILLTDDSEIHGLNRTYRGVDSATDVLSFSQQEGVGSLPASNLLGDVVISCETAAAQALEQNHSLQKEIFILLAHGVIHLIGYDHETSEKDKRYTDKKILELVELIYRD